MQLCKMNVVYEEKKNTIQYENNKIIFFIFLYKININKLYEKNTRKN